MRRFEARRDLRDPTRRDAQIGLPGRYAAAVDNSAIEDPGAHALTPLPRALSPSGLARLAVQKAVRAPQLPRRAWQTPPTGRRSCPVAPTLMAIRIPPDPTRSPPPRRRS